MVAKCPGCDGEFMEQAGDLSFCSVCLGTTDQRSGRFYPAVLTDPPPPLEESSFGQHDIEALARCYLESNRRLHVEYGVSFPSPTGQPPTYDELSRQQQLLLKAALAETIEFYDSAPSI